MVKQVAKKEISIETQNYWAVLTNEDARLKHFKLKKYKDRVEESCDYHKTDSIC